MDNPGSLPSLSLDHVRSLELDEVLDSLLERLEQIVPFDGAHVVIRDTHGTRVHCHRRCRRQESARCQPWDLDAHPLVHTLLRSRRSVIIADTLRHPLWPSAEATDDVRSWLAVPLLDGQEALGFCAVDKAQVGFFRDTHLRLAEGFALHAAIAVRHARQLERLRHDNDALAAQVAEYRRLLEVLPIGIAVARDASCGQIEANPYLAALLEVAPGANASLSAPPGEGPAGIHYSRDGRALPPEELPMQHAARTGLEVRGLELDLVKHGRKVATVLSYAAPIFDRDGSVRGAVGAALDITERKRAEERIHELAYLDELTELPNRRLFGDRLAVEVARTARQDQRLALVVVDVDRLKVVNDSLGHSAGDRVLRAVADRLRGCVRDGDTVARLEGGDEFAILLPDIGDSLDAAKLTSGVLDALRRPFDAAGRELFVTASAGISVFPDDATDAESLLRNADAAMHRAKERGRDNYQLYTPALTASAREKLALESHLRRAVALGQLEPYYQPIVDPATGVVHALEVLLRWGHPDRGSVSPSEFIPVAEASGLIHQIGGWVLEHACAAARTWHDAGHPDLSVAVNLSASQFQQADLTAQVKGVLERTGLRPDLLELEITESGAMESAEDTMGTLRALRALGVRLSIDDFGTGYSSLDYLRRFPIHALKIDRSFVRDLADDPDDAAIVSAIIALARTLKLHVVAEGVETEEQLELLLAQGCDRVQGFLYSPPVPAGEVPGVLQRLRNR